MVEAFVVKGEPEQLEAAVRFIKAHHLDDELRSHNWPAFSRGFNGPQYRANAYDTKLTEEMRGKPEYAVAFGYGSLVVDTGTFHGRPAVFVKRAEVPGVVGERAHEREAKDLDRVVPGETVLTFPTQDHARWVADALMGRNAPVPPQPPSGDGVEMFTDREQRIELGIAIRENIPVYYQSYVAVVDDIDILWDENARLRAERDAARSSRDGALRALARAEAALDARAGESADGWQPIETAPKDGRPVLAVLEKGLIVLTSWSSYYECWRVNGCSLTMAVVWWCPLPAPPSPPTRGA